MFAGNHVNFQKLECAKTLPSEKDYPDTAETPFFPIFYLDP